MNFFLKCIRNFLRFFEKKINYGLYRNFERKENNFFFTNPIYSTGRDASLSPLRARYTYLGIFYLKRCRESRENGKRQDGVRSAARETTAPHRCIHMCVFRYTGATRAGSHVRQTCKYRHESERSVQKSEHGLIRVFRKNACVNRIATATNASRKTSIIGNSCDQRITARHGFHR